MIKKLTIEAYELKEQDKKRREQAKLQKQLPELESPAPDAATSPTSDAAASPTSDAAASPTSDAAASLTPNDR